MPDNTDNQTSSNPQAAVDAALNGTTMDATTTSTTTTETTTPAPTSSDQQFASVPPQPPATTTTTTTTELPKETPSFEAAPVVTETTTVTSAPAAPASTPTMGDETPLAFMTPPPSSTTPVSTTVTTSTTTATDAPFIAPLPSSQAPTPQAPVKKSGKLGKVIMAGVVGLLMLAGGIFGGYNYYINNYGEEPVVAAITDKNKCSGCHNGGWLVWRNGQCKVTGICGDDKKPDTVDPTSKNLNSKSECEGVGKGYVWCSSVDSTGKSYAFCGTAGKGCNEEAIDRGYTIQLGIVKCKSDGRGGFIADRDDPAYANSTQQTMSQVDAQCIAQKMGTGSFICKEGVKGAGGVVYSGGACTNLNGKPFTGGLGCFCGTVQVDTGTGHTSYKSTCGCDEKTPPPSAPPPSAPPSVPPTMSCTGITRTPATATPAIGTKLTFTCAGVVTPASAGTLTYKFRYSLNSGAYTALANKTATTAELTLAACGSYSVQCQACTTLNGVPTCNPLWTGAAQQ